MLCVRFFFPAYTITKLTGYHLHDVCFYNYKDKRTNITIYNVAPTDL